MAARSITATRCRAKYSAAIIHLWTSRACSPKQQAMVHLTAPAWMRWAIYGMLNGEGIVLFRSKIFCCDYPSLDKPRVFTETAGNGAPDGSCVDAMGYLWNAEWGGNRIVQI